MRRIFYEFVGGSTMKDIAARLEKDQVPTAAGGAWAGATVRHILTNGLYAGKRQWAGVEMAIEEFPAIITVETYEAAVRRLKALKPGKPGRS